METQMLTPENSGAHGEGNGEGNGMGGTWGRWEARAAMSCCTWRRGGLALPRSERLGGPAWFPLLSPEVGMSK